MPALTFHPKHRLTHARQFQAVYAERLKAARGPMVLYAKRNDLPHPRLGLAIGRRLGNAVTRNRFKRFLRESFRLAQHQLPAWDQGHYDLVVTLHPHEERDQADYQRLFLELAQEIAARKPRRAPGKDTLNEKPTDAPKDQP